MNLLLNASYVHWKAKEAEATALLDVYLNKSAGIADHPGLLEEVNAAVEMLSQARENMTTIDLIINNPVNQPTPGMPPGFPPGVMGDPTPEGGN